MREAQADDKRDQEQREDRENDPENYASASFLRHGTDWAAPSREPQAERVD